MVSFSGMKVRVSKEPSSTGTRVALADMNETALRAEVDASGGKFRGKVCNITDRGQVAELFRWLGEEVGSIDILVNCAGINVANRGMANTDPADFDRVIGVNTIGTFNTMHAALAVMREKKSGLVVNLISLAGLRTYTLAGMPYTVSKFAMAALGNYANLEDGANGIRVTNIYPGEANTPLVDKRPQPTPPERRAKMLQPEDIAACVVMVAKLPPRAVVPVLVITNPYLPYT